MHIVEKKQLVTKLLIPDVGIDKKQQNEELACDTHSCIPPRCIIMYNIVECRIG